MESYFSKLEDNISEDRKVRGGLVGIDGNALMLMGYFQKLARQQGFDKEWIKRVLDEAKSLDYNHLVTTLLDNIEEEDE